MIGVVGGHGWYHHTGGGSDHQCLPLEDVEWNNPVAGNQHGSYMYGAEYRHNSDEYFSTDNMESITNPHNYDVPCSVCLVSGRSTHVMIPARLSCPRGWSMEYSGYLMSEQAAVTLTRGRVTAHHVEGGLQGGVPTTLYAEFGNFSITLYDKFKVATTHYVELKQQIHAKCAERSVYALRRIKTTDYAL
ncbi:hypothetical protein Bbelb_159970 [Branchiostoma belcheri]|nr:hypothetical protein Bbelb_159970 [Branchiostoma belcheri]